MRLFIRHSVQPKKRFQFHPLLKFSAILGMLSLAGCALIDKESTSTPKLHLFLEESTQQDGRACINTSSIRGWGNQDNRVVTINTSRRYYVATLLYSCQGLNTASQALFDSRFSRVCGGSNNYIVTREERCPIQSIFEFDNRDEAFKAIEQAEASQKMFAEQAKKKDI